MSSAIEDFIRANEGQSQLSDWMLVDQDLIDRFADTTRDWMFMHVDAEKAAETEFGGTIAHGFLLLSLLAPLRGEIERPRVPGLRTGLNYGLDRVRFVSPVRSGSRIRARFTISELSLEAPDKLREVMDVTLEVEGSERPAVVARWLTMYLL
ncbi:MaoC family dehydratase [Novosphingobium sp. PS1R-30]|uniref:MaoC family dehydratase n=1 Tax=Novosphingobium anseongense TaxID=3133436 RepID=A0ABU8RR05_9SPHN